MSDITLTIVLPEDPAKLCLGSEFRVVAYFEVYVRGLKIDMSLYKNNKSEYSLDYYESNRDRLYLRCGLTFCSKEDKQKWIDKLAKFYENEAANRPEEAKEAFRKAAREQHKPGEYIDKNYDYIWQEECRKIDREAEEAKP